MAHGFAADTNRVQVGRGLCFLDATTITTRRSRTQVVVRTRPSRTHELHEPVCVSCPSNGQTLQIKQVKDLGESRETEEERVYTFDACFGGCTTQVRSGRYLACILAIPSPQEELYTRCKIRSLVESATEGYVATILAFGQTGSGKTFTTLGMRFGPGPASATHPDSLVTSDGILLRAVFDAIGMMREAKWNLEVSPVRDVYLPSRHTIPADAAVVLPDI